MAHLDLLRRAQSQLSAARFLSRERPNDLAGVAGLAYQALDLAMKVLTTELDGADAATHRSRMQRTQELVQAQDRELAFLWRVRQQDFYGDTTPGGSMAIPSPEEIARALDIASEIIERIDSALHPQERPDPSNA